jgi:HlyD family secretion protein
LVAPASGLCRDGEGLATFVVSDGRAHKRAIVSPRRNARHALIDEGLVEGDTVILYPTDAIADAVRVRAR